MEMAASVAGFRCLIRITWLTMLCAPLVIPSLDVTEGPVEQQRGVVCAPKYKLTSDHIACTFGRSVSVVNAADKEFIVKKHNEYRASVDPPARNMLKMKWDDELAMLAQKWADQCDEAEAYTLRIPGRFSVSLNAARDKPSWTAVMSYWHEGSRDFNLTSPYLVDIFTTYSFVQMIHATASLVGCGFETCEGENNHVCFYAPLLQTDTYALYNPYKAGAWCAACPGHCVDSRLCDCGIVCENDAALNFRDCCCVCEQDNPAYQQPDCSLNCTLATEDAQCGKSDDLRCPFASEQCPLTCELCPYAEKGFKGLPPDPKWKLGKSESRTRKNTMSSAMIAVIVITTMAELFPSFL